MRRSIVLALTLSCALVSAAAVGLGWGQLRKRPTNSPAEQADWTDPSLSRRSDPVQTIASRALRSSEPGAKTSSDDQQALALGADQREYLWQVEHHGLVLSRFGFTRLAQALRRNDAADFLAVLSNGFEGRILEQPREVRLENTAVQLLRQEDSGHDPGKLDGKGFVARLFEDRKRFSRAPQVKLALMALAPTNPHDLESLWEGTCQLRMWGEVGPGRPGETVLYLRYRLPRPTEPILKNDGWLRFCSVTQRQIAEAPRFLMREVASHRGIHTEKLHDNWKKGTNLETVTGGEYLCDYNRDGCLDLLLVDLDGNSLYQGRPEGNMVDVTAELGIPQSPWLVGAAFVDLDNDGWEDLILGSQVLRNEAGRRFRARPSIPGLDLSASASLIVADYDRDGLMDLYATALGQMRAASWVGGEGKSVSGNALFHNEGNWRFTNLTLSSRASGGDRSTFSACWFDADENGWPDLYVINEFGSGVLLVNQGDGTFREHAVEAGPGDFGSMGIACGDYDNDGHIDLYVANMYSKAGNRVIGNLWPGAYPEPTLGKLRSLTVGSELHRNLGGLKFEQLGRQLQVADVGWAYGPAMIDLNNDGWLDIFATCGFASQSRDDPDG